MFFVSILLVKIEEFTDTIKCTTGIIHGSTTINPHMVVFVRLLESAIREVHVGIREELAVERATFHVDGSGMLEAMVVHVPEIESDILESRSTGDAGNAAGSSMCERHNSISLAFNSDILGKVGQSVVTCLDNFNNITCLGSGNSLCQRLVLILANLGDIADRINFLAVLSDGDFVFAVCCAVVNLNKSIQNNEGVSSRCFWEVFVSCTFRNVHNILKQRRSACCLYVQSRLVILAAVESTIINIDEMFFVSILLVKIEEFTDTIKCTTGIIHGSTTINPHMVVFVRLLESAIREVHVGIREELAVERATFHVDGAGVLETVVVDVSEVERHVLKLSAIGNAGNAAGSGMREGHDSVSLAFNRYVLRDVRQRVVASLNNRDDVASVCSSNSLSKRLVLRLADLGDGVRFDDCVIAKCSTFITTDNVAYRGRIRILVSVRQILNKSNVFNSIVGHSACGKTNYTTKVSIG